VSSFDVTADDTVRWEENECVHLEGREGIETNHRLHCGSDYRYRGWIAKRRMRETGYTARQGMETCAGGGANAMVAVM
jgi:hypothetical protein